MEMSPLRVGNEGSDFTSYRLDDGVNCNIHFLDKHQKMRETFESLILFRESNAYHLWILFDCQDADLEFSWIHS